MKPGPKRGHLELVGATAESKPAAETCGGRTKAGGECKKPPGQSTEHPGVGQCRHHDGQVEEGSPCPLPLTGLERRLWDQVVGQLIALKLYRLAFWPHIYGLTIALAGLHSARQSALGAAATIKGDNGAMKKHPSSTVTNQMLVQIRQFSNDLGLNPTALASMDLETDPDKPLSRMEEILRARRDRPR